MLQGLGLNATAEQVYRALLDEPTLEDADLARQLALPPAKVRAALEELIELELLRKSRQDPSRRYPVGLDRCITLLVRRLENELEARRQALVAAKATAAEVSERVIRQTFQAPAGVEHITELDDIQNSLESLTNSAEIEVCSMVPNVMPLESLEASSVMDDEILRRGVKCKVLCHESIRSKAFALDYERHLTARGAQVRISPVLPLRLLITDRTTAMLPFDPEIRDDGAILTTAPGMVKALCELFDRLWEVATPLKTALGSDTDAELSDSEAELLKILSSGLTDEAAAKRLGVSVRTVKRRMEDLMRRLEAGSRFEAGFRAAKRGWL